MKTHKNTSATKISAQRRPPIPEGKTRDEWATLERLASEELSRRTAEAHAKLLMLLGRYTGQFSAKQMLMIRKRLASF